MSPQARAALEAAGVVFGEVFPENELFQSVELPEGWKKFATTHSMHNELRDGKGRLRATIFYKATDYDRQASLHCVPRFYLGVSVDDENGIAQAVVTDCGQNVFLFAPVTFDQAGGYQAANIAKDIAKEEALKWLTDHYPEWKNISAYWDDSGV